MKESITYVQPVQVDAMCEQCGEIMHRERGPGGTYTWPGWYRCENCGHREQSNMDYPRIEFRVQ